MLVENFTLFNPGGAFLIKKLPEDNTVNVMESNVFEDVMVVGMFFEIAIKLFQLIVHLFIFWKKNFYLTFIFLHVRFKCVENALQNILLLLVINIR